MEVELFFDPLVLIWMGGEFAGVDLLLVSLCEVPDEDFSFEYQLGIGY
jgi:hypothetical protein